MAAMTRDNECLSDVRTARGGHIVLPASWYCCGEKVGEIPSVGALEETTMAPNDAGNLSFFFLFEYKKYVRLRKQERVITFTKHK